MDQFVRVVHQQHGLLHLHSVFVATGDEGNSQAVTRGVGEYLFHLLVEAAVLVAREPFNRVVAFLEDLFEVGRKLRRDRSGESFAGRVSLSLGIRQVDRFLPPREINIRLGELCLAESATKG